MVSSSVSHKKVEIDIELLRHRLWLRGITKIFDGESQMSEEVQTLDEHLYLMANLYSNCILVIYLRWKSQPISGFNSIVWGNSIFIWLMNQGDSQGILPRYLHPRWGRNFVSESSKGEIIFFAENVYYIWKHRNTSQFFSGPWNNFRGNNGH